MKKLALTLFVILLTCSAFAANIDPAYIKAFGGGKIIVSGTSLPALTKYDASQFSFKDGKFFIPAGENGMMYARALLPAGKTIGMLIDDAKKKFGENVKFMESEITSFRVWCSHDENGNEKVGGNFKWPASLNDEPAWASPICDYQVTVDSEMRGWDAQAAVWEDNLRSDVQRYLAKAKAGTKFFIQYSVGFSSMTPGGQMESKWNSILQRFEQVESQGLLSYNLMPVAIATVEVTGGADSSSNWKLITKPAKDDGVAEGLISVMKGGKELCKAKVMVKNKFTYNQTGIIAWDITIIDTADESRRGGFDTEAKTMEEAIGNVAGQFIERWFSEENN